LLRQRREDLSLLPWRLRVVVKSLAGKIKRVFTRQLAEYHLYIESSTEREVANWGAYLGKRNSAREGDVVWFS
jgi:hypothetical protein